MSKKINLSLKNIHNDLSSLFHQHLLNKANDCFMDYSEDNYYEMMDYWDKVFPGWDSDDSIIIQNNKKGRKHKHHHRSRARVLDITTPYSGSEENPTEIDDEYDDNDYQEKVIFFYPDYHYKDDRLEFNSLKSFDSYCCRNGYVVPKYIEDDIIYRCESHCCLNPTAEKNGILEIMAEESYGEMFYEACDVSELDMVQ